MKDAPACYFGIEETNISVNRKVEKEEREVLFGRNFETSKNKH